MSSASSQKLVSIQYLRALSAVGVLLFHACGIHVGAAGVDVFFVISGFVITVSSRRTVHRIDRFALDRIVRVAPLYWCITIALATAAAILPSLFRRVRPNFADVLMSLFFIPHLDPGGEAWPLLIQGWTLNLEMLFYALFACTLLIPRHSFIVRLGLLIALALASFASDRYAGWERTYLNPMFLEFGAGVVIGQLSLRQKRLPPGAALLLIATGFTVFALSTFLPVEVALALPRAPEWERVIIWGGGASALLLGIVSYELCHGIRLFPPLLLLGDASYSLYLVQGLIIASLGRMAGPAAAVIAVPASIGAGIALHLLFEKPITRRLRSWVQTRSNG